MQNQTNKITKTMKTPQVTKNKVAHKNPIPFYISIVSLTAIFSLLLIFLLEKNENLKFASRGLVQEVSDGKIIWVEGNCKSCCAK